MSNKVLLRLYVIGQTARSINTIKNIKKICEEELKGNYELKIIDILENPKLAEDEKILAAPTLIKKLPLPLKRIIGDLSDKEKVLIGLDIISIE
jgi:circadian clock protein KaiB